MKIKKITAGYLKPLLAPRRRSSHKGDYGSVLVVAGSRGLDGAAVLAARAALKAGAGLVTVACPETERKIIACALPEAMTFGAAASGGSFSVKAASQVAALVRNKKISVMLIGPGLGSSPSARAFALKVLKTVKLPAVVDADALNAVAAAGLKRTIFAGGPLILTPHPGEAARLLGRKITDRPGAAAELSGACGGVAVLKGEGTLVALGKTIFKNTTGGPALAKGGSGDVLAGLTAGFLAQAGAARGFTPETAQRAAALAVHLHGLAGDLAAKKFTERGVLAGELLEFLPAAIRRVR